MAAGQRRNRLLGSILAAVMSATPTLAADRNDRDLSLKAQPRVAQAPPRKPTDKPIDRICDLIAHSADANGLPRDFFARLIWKESRFDEKAVSPVGAQGIAQFMPATAKVVGLADPFDMEQALPASARHLADLRRTLGNLGRTAAAYNAGEGRVDRWLRSGGFLPLETEGYVLDIMGEDAANFAARDHQGTNRRLHKTLEFDAACRQLPIIMSRTVPMARIHTKPWGVQVAGNVRRAAAMNQWQRVRGQFSVLRQYQAVVGRVRSPIARSGVYAVRIGVDSRGAADKICAQLRSVGGACVVVRNR